jgi:hypothetical protein
MDCMTLLDTARAKGIEVDVVDGQLCVTGDRQHETLVRQLLDQKEDIIPLLEPPVEGEDTALTAYTALPIGGNDPWPDAMDDAALYGLIGDIVNTIEPHTEADPVAVLVQSLIAFGNVIGRSAHFRAEADLHYGNMFCCLVGETSKGRKGTSWGHTARLLEPIDPDWQRNIQSGLSSGEGLIWAVRDPVSKPQPQYEGKGRNKSVVSYEDVIVDQGVDDKRLLVLESEFSSVLKVAGRERNTVSAIIRQAWDSGSLQTLTKNSPARATDAHISIIGHITRDELRRLITETDLANGLANRFLWLCVRRSKCLPEGGSLRPDDLSPHVQRLRAAVEFASSTGELRRDSATRDVWRGVYPTLSQGKPGLLGAATSRSEAQTMRLAMLYALLDRSQVIREEHLLAGLAVWTYADQSARYIFGSALGDPVADAILRELRRVHPDSLTRNDIREHFRRNKSAEEISRALGVLFECHLVRCERVETGGRPAEIWFARI